MLLLEWFQFEHTVVCSVAQESGTCAIVLSQKQSYLSVATWLGSGWTVYRGKSRKKKALVADKKALVASKKTEKGLKKSHQEPRQKRSYQQPPCAAKLWRVSTDDGASTYVPLSLLLLRLMHQSGVTTHLVFVLLCFKVMMMRRIGACLWWLLKDCRIYIVYDK